jgi:hypothetical protein
LLRDLDRQALAPVVGDVEAENHVMPLCMCLAPLLRNALENLLLLAWRRARLAGGTAAAVVLFGLHLLYQQQRAASLVLRPPAQAASG